MMKSRKKITRVRLQVDRSDDFVLFGIVSSEPDYKLSLSLNQSLGISLRNITAIASATDDGDEVQFSRFTYTDNSTDRAFTLFSNRTGKNYLVRKLKNIDYLLHIHDPEGIEDSTPLSSKLKNTGGITALFHIHPDKVKDSNLDLIIQ